MFNNIEIMEINRKGVMESTWVSFISVFGIGFLILLVIEGIMAAAGVCFLGLIYGAPIYAPTIIICLLMERYLIRENSTKRKVAYLFVAEAIIATVIAVGILGFHSYYLLGIFSIYAGALFIRWRYLLSKGRLYNSIYPKTGSYAH
jgi:hypothetical protein